MDNTNLSKEPFSLEKVKTQSEDELFYFVDNKSINSERITAPRYSYWKSVFRIFFKSPLNWALVGLFVLILIMSYIYPATTSFDQFKNLSDPTTFNLSPAQAINKFGFSFEYLLGTGASGESIFLNVWFGARTSISLALACAAINMIVGVIMGAVWGYNKTVDAIMVVVYNIVSNVPYILLITILVYVIGHGFIQFIFALTITGWLSIAYFFRNQVLIIRGREYNLASKCLGTPLYKTVTKNILPFMTSVIMTILATEIPSYISSEVFLSYLGVGLNADIPSLGRMISSAQTSWTTYPWRFWAPVSVSALITIILYVLGQNLADASDPRTHMQ